MLSGTYTLRPSSLSKGTNGQWGFVALAPKAWWPERGPILLPAWNAVRSSGSTGEAPKKSGTLCGASLLFSQHFLAKGLGGVIRITLSGDDLVDSTKGQLG